MIDDRAKRLAGIVVEYSLSINSADKLLIRSEDYFSDFAKEIGRQAEKKGAEVFYDFSNLIKKKELIDRFSISEFKNECRRLCNLADKATAVVRVDSLSDPLFLKDVDPKKIAEFHSVLEPFQDRIVGDGKKFKGKKWVVVAYPSNAKGEIAGIKNYPDFIFTATNKDWSKESEKLKQVKKVFDNAGKVRILVPGSTDLIFSLKGRGGAVCDGKFNMPDGEVYYGPVEDSAEGFISFPYPVLVRGNMISGIKLKYKNGEVVEFSAKENEELLKSIINSKGARRIGEFGIGCNYNINKYSKDILFDEKIGGTIHIAVGRSYKYPLSEGGGLNDSNVHIDLVCDLRSNGRIYVDNKLVQKNGEWIF